MIAIDVMGGDHAPDVVLCGAIKAAKQGVSVGLFGPQALITDWLQKNTVSWHSLPLQIINAPDIVRMDDEPVAAVRKKNSSLVSAVASVAQGQYTAVLSAGNSGALMAASTFILGRTEGVERPAIAGFLPTTQNKEVLVLDLGANTECRPSHLQAFAHVGVAYVGKTCGIQNPRVGILSNGHEEGKGSILVKETYALLKQDRLNFVGNLEPQHVFNYEADVVVCDGFSGNILLKTMESIVEAMFHWLPQEHAAVLADRFAYKKIGGALLLGVRGTVIVCHGSSDADVIENAIKFAWNITTRHD